ncbi:multicopper oxidase family protein [Micromonospora sp. NRRL B-16802]|uniref:multicopper oxidase family protein n=1 Tax=unclassified Micromonospora TaxID=2617518 RepID=UPI0006B00244|nr:multicopper oxidase family protein [Micromonospora sp. NRRL B-16802]KOX03134.1 bilirubin oxidase [Micromonospora sp. NRRL B-16802]
MLALGGATGVALVIPTAETTEPAVAAPGGHPRHHHRRPSRPVPSADTGEPFTRPLVVPPVLRPVAVTATTDHYRLDVTTADVEIVPGLRSRMLSYGGHAVNPTIRARQGRRVRVTYRNRLDQPVNVHLHGGHVAAADDGHPMDLIQPGQERVYDYPNQQAGAPLWYHDHSHHTESEHVYRGLYGFYLIEGSDEAGLRLPSGQYDIPIALRDSLFAEDGTLVWNQADPFSRTTLLANNRHQPYFPVAARRYRLRLLNASTHRTFEVHANGATLLQIGGDGGLLPAPVPRTSILLGSAERAEVVIDFSGNAIGDQVFLADATGGPLVRFDVVRRATDSSRVPPQLRPLPPMPRATAERLFVMRVDPVTFASLINDKAFDPARVDTTITRGTTEIWKIVNGDAGLNLEHTFHMHLAQFRVLDRDGAPPSPGESGFKDTIYVRPGESVRVQATFDGFVGRYLYHCHMLDHSAFGMMGQMEVVPPGS